MVLRLELIEDDALPRGAWCLQAKAHCDVVVVRHGTGVELLDSAFVFGAWPGPFAEAEYASASVRMGTGAALRDGALVLLPPSHPYEHVAIARDGDQLLASNSLVCVLAMTGAAPLVSECRYYFRLNAAHAKPTKLQHIRFDTTTLTFLLCDPFVVGPDLSVRRAPAAMPISLPDFSAYRCHLLEVLDGLARNAQSAHRRNPLSLSATISAGYDSAASAAVACDAGWRDAVTFVRGPDDPDDGVAIGQRLGYRVERCPATAWRAAGPFPEAEFLAASGPTPRLQLAGASDAFAEALVLNGNSGDVVWNTVESQLRPGVARVGAYVTSSTSATEWALRIGAVQVPAPAIGAAESVQIARLAAAPEMTPWTLGTAYDRPIPRRLLEEKAVPRDAFGTAKRGGCYVETPRGMTDASRADFRAWLAAYHSPRSRARRHASWYMSRGAVSGLRTVARRSRTSRTFGERQLLSQPSWEKGHLFHWGVDKTRERYRTASFD